jgi:Tfp pilus assembly protein PilF
MFVARTAGFRRAAALFTALAASVWAVDRGVCRAQAPRAQGRQSPGRAATSGVLAEGIAAFERGEFDAARALFRKALGTNPNDAEAHKYLGLLADRAGDLEAAREHFGRAARLAPSSAAARNNHGVILLRTGRAREAAAEFEASLKVDPAQPNALVNLAQIRFTSGGAEDLRAAADLFARADQIAPDPELARALTVIALRRGDPEGAAAHYRNYAARAAAGGSASASDARSRAELGAALLEAGLAREAEAELSAAARLDPANAEAVVQLARAQLARKDVRGAGRTLEGAVARGVDAAPVYALLAEVYEQAGHPENAIPAMRLAIQRDPQSEKYRFAYGLLLTNAYAPAAAVIRLEEALRTFPDSPRLWFALGLARLKHNRDDESAEAFGRAAELDPKFAPAYAYLGILRVKKGDNAEGLALYEKALQIDPKLAVVHHLVAEALLKQPEADAARVEAHLRRAVELDPTFVAARLALGKLFMRGERWAEAVAELERAAALDPGEAEAHYQLGRAYARLRRTAEAQAALATFKRLNETQKKRDEHELREIVRRLGSVRF